MRNHLHINSSTIRALHIAAGDTDPWQKQKEVNFDRFLFYIGLRRALSWVKRFPGFKALIGTVQSAFAVSNSFPKKKEQQRCFFFFFFNFAAALFKNILYVERHISNSSANIKTVSDSVMSIVCNFLVWKMPVFANRSSEKSTLIWNMQVLLFFTLDLWILYDALITWSAVFVFQWEGRESSSSFFEKNVHVIVHFLSHSETRNPTFVCP